MARPTRNPFYVILGLVGFLFTITASSYCLSVLRGVRPETATDHGGHAFERIMDRHGTAILTGELIVLAIATVGAVAVDHAAGQREITERQAAGGRAVPPSHGADEP
ncbi:MAG: hypothetical protein EBR23_04360 [Planctomycetia bacterium]|nr:hypothetical protein [Planctomycetia bacterium]